MTALEFLIWLRDTMHCTPQSKEGDKVGKPSNGELRRWLAKGVVRCNGKTLHKDSEVEWPITELVFFPKSARCTIV